jgi:hypothetical protein
MSVFSLQSEPAALLLAVYARCTVDHGDPDPCRIWTGSRNVNGYPLLSVLKPDGGRTSVGARRTVWQADGRKPLPLDRFLSMRCGERACLNPAHMVPRTRVEYLAHRSGRRNADEVLRATLGRRRGRDVKLSVDLARQVRARLHAGELGTSIAADLGVSRSLVSQIKANRLWRETSPFAGLMVMKGRGEARAQD